MDDHDNHLSVSHSPISRRSLVSGGIAAAAATTGAVGQERPDPAAGEPPRDPVSKYPKPPFKRQSQPWPGLAGRMDTRTGDT